MEPPKCLLDIRHFSQPGSCFYFLISAVYLDTKTEHGTHAFSYDAVG